MSGYFHPMNWAEVALRTADIGSAWDEVGKMFGAFGLTGTAFIFGQPVTIRDVPQPARKFGIFIDEEWDRRLRSDTRLALGDPVARRFQTSERALHVWRGNSLYHSMSEEEQAFFWNYDELGVQAGAVWPCHDRKVGTYQIVASWTKEDGRDYVKAVSQYSTDIHIAVTYFCEALRVRELAGPEHGVTLSRRERECLLWVYAGRSSQDIGEILTLSENTVNEYIASAVKKLEATNRVQAAARATMLGMLQP